MEKSVEEIIESLSGLDPRGYGLLEHIGLMFEMWHFRGFYSDEYTVSLEAEIKKVYSQVMEGFEIVIQEAMEKVELKILVPRQKTEEFSLDDVQE